VPIAVGRKEATKYVARCIDRSPGTDALGSRYSLMIKTNVNQEPVRARRYADPRPRNCSKVAARDVRRVTPTKFLCSREADGFGTRVDGELR